MIRCAAYDGVDQGADVILSGDGEGRLDRQVRGALAWVKSLGRTETYNGLLREDRPLMPEPAVREALVNAVVHRDYAVTGSPVLLEVFNDRVAVTSPGALPNHMTVESVLAGGRPRSRNEAMGNVGGAARGTPRPRLADDAPRDAGVQRHRAGTAQRRERQVRAGELPPETGTRRGPDTTLGSLGAVANCVRVVLFENRQPPPASSHQKRSFGIMAACALKSALETLVGDSGRAQRHYLRPLLESEDLALALRGDDACPLFAVPDHCSPRRIDPTWP